jgi:hypothetical protein
MPASGMTVALSAPAVSARPVRRLRVDLAGVAATTVHVATYDALAFELRVAHVGGRRLAAGVPEPGGRPVATALLFVPRT